jgi:sortase A
MVKYYYKDRFYLKKFLRVFGALSIIFGVSLLGYILFPLLSWQVFFAGAYSQNIDYPIPKATVLGATNFGELISSANLAGVDYTNAKNWFPNFNAKEGEAKVPSYSLSIPAIDILNAEVSTRDQDLAKHLIQFNPTIPGENGNPVIFGHSTLPYLFDPGDYKTIFANLYKVKVGDEILAEVSGVSYKYKVFEIKVVNPNDTSVLEQKFDDSYLTLVTCTPPGTVWKRLIIKTKLEKI